MVDLGQLTSEEIVALCQQHQALVNPPDPDHEGWQRDLVITPRIVEQILLANTEE